MAIDTTELGDVEYPGEEEGVASPPRERRAWWRSGWLRPHLLWAIVGGVVGYLLGHWLGNVIASGYSQVQSTRARTTWPSCSASPSASPAGWPASAECNYPLAKLVGLELAPAPPERNWVRYFRMTEDHKVVGLAVRGRRAHLPLHRRPAGDADPHRAAQPDQPHLRAGHLHRHRRASTARS